MSKKKKKDQIWRDRVYKNVLEWTKSEEMTEQTLNFTQIDQSCFKHAALEITSADIFSV